jgi:hypothetical protein
LREELEKAGEATRKQREERSDMNKKLLDIVRTNRARRQANGSAREKASSTLEMEREATEIQRIREQLREDAISLVQIRKRKSGRELLGSRRNWRQSSSVLTAEQNSCVKRMCLSN